MGLVGGKSRLQLKMVWIYLAFWYKYNVPEHSIISYSSQDPRLQHQSHGRYERPLPSISSTSRTVLDSEQPYDFDDCLEIVSFSRQPDYFICTLERCPYADKVSWCFGNSLDHVQCGRKGSSIWRPMIKTCKAQVSGYTSHRPHSNQSPLSMPWIPIWYGWHPRLLGTVFSSFCRSFSALRRKITPESLSEP